MDVESKAPPDRSVDNGPTLFSKANHVALADPVLCRDLAGGVVAVSGVMAIGMAVGSMAVGSAPVGISGCFGARNVAPCAAKEDLVGKRGHDMQSNDFAKDSKDGDGRNDKATIENAYIVVVCVWKAVWIGGAGDRIRELHKRTKERAQRRRRRGRKGHGGL